MATLTERMMGAAQLDLKTFEEVEHDATATGQAMMVVVLASVAAGIGNIGYGGMSGIIWGTVVALVAWFIWALLTFLIGTKLMPEPTTKADLAQMLRVLGFAATPGILRVLGIIPLLGWVIGFVIWIWMLIAMVIAVRQALDYSSTGRAVVVCLIGWIVYVVVSMVLAVPAFLMNL
jgi:hypothetical protein